MLKTVFAAIAGLIAPNAELQIDLARVQWAEREERRATLDRETLGDLASQKCRARVISRMTEGDKVWIPPYYNREKAYRKWLKRQRKAGRPTNVQRING